MLEKASALLAAPLTAKGKKELGPDTQLAGSLRLNGN